MTCFPLRARSWLSLALVSALAPMACLPDNPESLDDDDDGSATDTEANDTDETGTDETGDSTEPLPTWRSLVDNAAWQPDAAEDDPLLEHRPEQIECENGWYPESGGIEVDTEVCNYLSLRQPLLESIEPGDPLHLQLWWQTLASVDPAEGHLALYVDGELLWEELVPIPGDADARSLDFASPLAAPAGATLTFHLHNHGYNTWHFHELSVLSSRP
jgi:hypothetical protein